jgi:hypothetical protein
MNVRSRFALLCTVSVLASSAIEGRQTWPFPSMDEAAFRQWWPTQPTVTILGLPSSPAKVVVVGFFDWQCPICRDAHQAFQPIVARYATASPGLVSYLRVDFPMDSKCNDGIPVRLNKAACDASVLYRFSKEAGKSAAVERWLNDNLKALTPELIRTYAAESLGIGDFEKEYARFLPEITADAARGKALRLTGLPKYFVNGRPFQRAGYLLSPKEMELAIYAELQRVKSIDSAATDKLRPGSRE